MFSLAALAVLAPILRLAHAAAPTCAGFRRARPHSRTALTTPPPHPHPALTADTRSAIQKARQIAAEFEFSNGYPMPIAYLAKKLADENQVYTQVCVWEEVAGARGGVAGWW